MFIAEVMAVNVDESLLDEKRNTAFVRRRPYCIFAWKILWTW